MTVLFREEAMIARRNRLHGRVILHLPLSTKLLVLALVTCIAIAGFWVSTGEYARTQTVPGILITTDPSLKIFPQRPGRVEQFALEEGERVKAGQVLAVINTDIVSEEGRATANFATQAIETRLALASESAAMSRENAATEKAQLLGQIASFDRQIANTRHQITLQRDIVQSNQTMLQRVEEIIDRGFISRFDYERRRQNLLSSEQNLSSLEQNLEKLESDRANASAELEQVGIVTAKELSDIESSISSLAVEKAQFEGQRGYIIRAPIAGRVTAIQTAPGRQASDQTPLLIIVPEEASLRARLYAPSAAIGMVEPGQRTTLLLDAFPYQRFGSMPGTIIKVSRNVLDPRDADVPFRIEQPVYQIEAALQKQTIDAFGSEVPLTPGMTLTANIVLEKQTFLGWLLTPLNAVLNRN